MKRNILVLSNFIVGLHSFRKEVMKAVIDAGYQLYISVPDAENGTQCRIITERHDSS